MNRSKRLIEPTQTYIANNDNVPRSHRAPIMARARAGKRRKCAIFCTFRWTEDQRYRCRHNPVNIPELKELADHFDLQARGEKTRVIATGAPELIAAMDSGAAHTGPDPPAPLKY